MITSLPDDALLHLAETAPLAELLERAAALRDAGHGRRFTYSPKVFIPLTHLCRDVCAYCTFAEQPSKGKPAYMSRDQVLAVARAGAEAGCKEALFTLGDKPELRYQAARDALAGLGHPTTLSYLEEMCAAVLAETGLLPHVNAGVMGRDDIARLRRVSVSQGLMLESASDRLCERGGPHFGSPDKAPAARLETIRLAGELQVPFTSGILIGIGETRGERIEALFALRDLHRTHGHLQEIIIQNFRAKIGTRMVEAPEPDQDELLWTIAMARLVFGPAMNIQAPPNLSPSTYPKLIEAGINDWGGISPVTRDHVNPEAPWPHVEALRARTAEQGRLLVERLPVYPEFVHDTARWQDKALVQALLGHADADGLARMDPWAPGVAGLTAKPQPNYPGLGVDPDVVELVARASAGEALDEAGLVRLFQARGPDFDHVVEAADALRREVNGSTVTYVVNRNINYTNICTYKCSFCAFSKGKTAATLRGTPYDLDGDEVVRRAKEAWDRGATEICMQGGIHPDYTGETYLELVRSVKAEVPGMHVHAFSPLEVQQGAATLGIAVSDYLRRLRNAGLGTLPGTAAEILDDEMRAILCPDKLSTDEWLNVVEASHEVGFRTTATIMFGHVDQPKHWARHLIRLRGLQEATGGFTEFVPLPFVHMEAPLYLKGRARRGPTMREAILMHAVARLAFHPVLTNIQVSWVKMGRDGVKACLNAGANDLGGTLMNESISRAAGTEHGQELPPEEMEHLIRQLGRTPLQRSTLYGDVPPEHRARAFDAAPLEPLVMTPPKRRQRAQAYANAALETD